MRPREFLLKVPEAVRPLLPADLQGFRHRLAFSYVQLYYVTPRIHYEVWLQRKTNRIEIGLHFEHEGDINHHLLRYMSQRFPEIQEQLGSSVEMEEWTRSWTRVQETIAMGALDEAVLERAAQHTAALITATWPLLVEEVPAS